MFRLVLPCLLVATALGQGPASLLRDIRLAPPTQLSSSPLFGARVGSGRFVFAATGGAVGEELWSVSSTGTGPVLVRDINVGPQVSFPRNFVSLGGVALFTAREDDSGYELWRTDGTAAGTWMVRDIRPGPLSSMTSTGSFQVFGGAAFFAADDGATGRELWRSDGTAAGTSLVADLAPGITLSNPDHSNPDHFAVLRTDLLFAATTPGTGTELWKTRGTGATTVLVRDIEPAGSSSPTDLTTVGSTLFFAAEQGGDRELWKSNGTSVGTVRVDDISSAGSSNPAGLTAFGAELMFTAYDVPMGRELWRSDGTARGTAMVRDIATGTLNGAPASSSPVELVVAGGRTFFSAFTVASGRELWLSDGTSAGTLEVVDLLPGFGASGANSSSPQSLTVVQSARGLEVYFTASDGATGGELWRTSGTAAGTMLVADLAPGAASSLPSDLFVIPGGLATADIVLFQATDGVMGRELGRTQGTPATTSLVDLNPATTPSFPRHFASDGGRTFFSADDGVHGHELWVTDGTPAGTRMVADILPGSVGSSPLFLTPWNGVLYFTALDGTAGFELWRSDGTLAGTWRVADIHPGVNHSSPSELTVVGDWLYFDAFEPTHGRELWKSDGTAAGTMLVADLVPGSAGCSPGELSAFGGRLLFAATTPAAGREIWGTDGTAAGTVLVAETVPGTGHGSPASLTVSGSWVYFAALSQVGGMDLGAELWRTDGTAAGTMLVADLWPGPGHATPRELTAVEFSPGAPSLCFVATTPTEGDELFWTDGGSAGAALIRDIRPGALGSKPRYLTRVERPGAGDLVVFSANDGTTGREPWRTDGTAAGTVPLADVAAGAWSSCPLLGGWFFSLPGARQVLFPADDGSHGVELMRHDLVAGTTTLHQDLLPGPLSSVPFQPVLAGSRLLFSAFDSAGFEPRVMTSMAAALPYGANCAGGSGLSPVLRATDTPYLGNAAFGYRLSGAPPGTLTFALFDFARSNQQFGACTLLVQPFIAHFALADSAGVASYPLPVSSSPAVLGYLIQCQGLVYDPPAPMFGLLSASGALEALLGPN